MTSPGKVCRVCSGVCVCDCGTLSCVCVCVCVFAGNQEVYNRLGVTIIERGESFYQSFMPDVVKDLESKGKVT